MAECKSSPRDEQEYAETYDAEEGSPPKKKAASGSPGSQGSRCYYCKYCKQTWPLSHFRNSQQFGAHCSNCSRRPRPMSAMALGSGALLGLGNLPASIAASPLLSAQMFPFFLQQSQMQQEEAGHVRSSPVTPLMGAMASPLQPVLPTPASLLKPRKSQLGRPRKTKTLAAAILSSPAAASGTAQAPIISVKRKRAPPPPVITDHNWLLDGEYEEGSPVSDDEDDEEEEDEEEDADGDDEDGVCEVLAGLKKVCQPMTSIISPQPIPVQEHTAPPQAPHSPLENTLQAQRWVAEAWQAIFGDLDSLRATVAMEESSDSGSYAEFLAREKNARSAINSLFTQATYMLRRRGGTTLF